MLRQMRNGASLITKLKKKKEQNTNKSGRDYLFKFVTTILEIVSLILTLPPPALGEIKCV